MESRDEFAVRVARSFLRDDEDAIEVAVLDALIEDASQSGEGLDGELAKAAESERRSGAFGLEIAGAFVVPILIEIGRQLWTTYSKELASKVGKDLAGLTADRLQDWIKARTHTDGVEAVKSDLEQVVRRVGAAEKLTESQIAALVAAVREGHVVDTITAG